MPPFVFAAFFAGEDIFQYPRRQDDERKRQEDVESTASLPLLMSMSMAMRLTTLLGDNAVVFLLRLFYFERRGRLYNFEINILGISILKLRNYVE